MQDSLVAKAANCDSAAFVDVAEQRAGIAATSDKPVFQGVGGTVRGIAQAIFSSFRPANRQFAGLDVVVGKVKADTLGTPQTGSIENGDQDGVTNPGRRRIASTSAQPALQPQLASAVLSEQIAVSDIPANHLSRAVSGLVHDGPLRRAGNGRAGSVPGP